jgi:hypothetical protein
MLTASFLFYFQYVCNHIFISNLLIFFFFIYIYILRYLYLYILSSITILCKYHYFRTRVRVQNVSYCIITYNTITAGPVQYTYTHKHIPCNIMLLFLVVRCVHFIHKLYTCKEIERKRERERENRTRLIERFNSIMIRISVDVKFGQPNPSGKNNDTVVFSVRTAYHTATRTRRLQ